MTNSLENRRSFRVHESVYVKFDKLTEDEFAAGIDHRNLLLGANDQAQAKLVAIDTRLNEAMYLLNNENAAMGRCISLLNDKVNVAIDELPSFRASKQSLAKTPPQTCDLSADGIVFSSRNALKAGDKLHIRLLLSSDNHYVETFCEVIRLTEPPAADSPQLKFGIAVEFVDLGPAQREMLIQHMFSCESQTLRMRRLELESTDAEA